MPASGALDELLARPDVEIVLNLTVPPLRMRREDIPLLARHFLARCARSLRKSVQGFSPEAMALLSAYGWPGNVRELENSIERATNLAMGELIEPVAAGASARKTKAAASGDSGIGALRPKRARITGVER